MKILKATEYEIELGRRLRRGEWYRVTSGCQLTRCRTLRRAQAVRADFERSGLDARIEIYGEA